MDEMKLQKANEMLSKIKHLDNIINHFIDNDGTLRHKPENSTDVLVKFFTHCNNLTSGVDMNKLANTVIDELINSFICDVNILRQNFKEL